MRFSGFVSNMGHDNSFISLYIVKWKREHDPTIYELCQKMGVIGSPTFRLEQRTDQLTANKIYDRRQNTSPVSGDFSLVIDNGQTLYCCTIGRSVYWQWTTELGRQA